VWAGGREREREREREWVEPSFLPVKRGVYISHKFHAYIRAQGSPGGRASGGIYRLIDGFESQLLLHFSELPEGSLFTQVKNDPNVIIYPGKK